MQARLGWLVMVAFLVSGVLGSQVCQAKDGEKAKKEKKPKPVMEDLTLTGKVTKTETPAKKEGQNPKISYTLELEDGSKVRLPVPKAPKKKKGAEEAAPVINLDDYVDADVVIMAKGFVKEKKEKKSYVIKTIESITKAGEAEEGGTEAADDAGEDNAM